MKQKDMHTFFENHDEIFQAFQNTLAEKGLGHLSIVGLEIKAPLDLDVKSNIKKADFDNADNVFAFDDCPEGYIRVFKIDPITKKQYPICIPDPNGFRADYGV